LARTYRHLDLDERRTLFRMVEARRPVGEIAARLGRHPSTIHRELGRNRFRDGDRGFCGYFPLNAQDLARRRRQRRRKLAADEGSRGPPPPTGRPAQRHAPALPQLPDAQGDGVDGPRRHRCAMVRVVTTSA
jgi:hypothetical protein